MHLPQPRDINTVPVRLKPPHHLAHVRHEIQERATQHPERGAHLLPGPPAHDLLDLLAREVVPREPHGLAAPRAGVGERPRRDRADVVRRDELQGFRAEGVAPRRHEHLGGEARGEVLHERGGAQDRPAHLAAGVGGAGLEVQLDGVLGAEVRDRGRVRPGAVVAAAVDGRVDEVLDVVREGLVDEGFAVFLFLF